jgi:hypothetical protein
VGRGPLLVNDPKYFNTYGDGFVYNAGRVSDYATTPHGLLAAVASGGVYRSSDLGAHWTSIGDSLPTQTVGSVAYTSAGRGTIVALTGDNAFGGYTYSGVGAYWSTNGGRRWVKSRGIPNGAMGFKVAVDPTNPKVVYAATGLGLYRSSDAGRSFGNVDLPTGRCHGSSFRRGCFLANVVTDVVVQSKDGFGHRGGAVLAAVGWRAGQFKNADGTVQAPANGFYRSASGRAHTFTSVPVDNTPVGPRDAIGRVELGAATGPAQDHGYVYAEVQDAKLFNSGKVEGIDTGANGDPLGLGIDPTATPTYFKGVYVSPDFGLTWRLLAPRQTFQNPANGSTLAQLQPLGFGPGIQSWYDEWLKPDPTRQSPIGGVPTRLEVGLEEIYENKVTVQPLDGLTQSDFRATGPYNGTGGACILVLAQPACSSKQGVVQATTTHPDQHAGIWVPGSGGGVHLVVGNDGGAYTQNLAASQETTQAGFGPGAQTGFHTLLPYGVAVSRDGTVYAGLQDNGEIRIDRHSGKQNEVFGGDGVFTVVNPANSNEVWEETPEAGIRVSTDGGVNWTDNAPVVHFPSFYSPLLMDPRNHRHIVTGGREVAETTSGADTNGNTSDAADHTTGTPEWVRVFDLGTRLHPGKAPPIDDVSGNPVLGKTDVENQVSAEDVRGAAVYAGFCGDCDPVREHIRFHSGLATNVGARGKPRSLSSSGWHIAKARGLPQRLITSVTIDPQNVRTVYVTLGNSSLRPYAPAGALGPDGISRAGGTVYQSTDAGATFHNISGNLPRGAADWTVLRGRQLIVGTLVGVFAARSGVVARGRVRAPRYARLGHGLPNAPVFSMQLRPGDPRQLYVATLGRGVYKYTFTRTGCSDRVPPGSHLDSGRIGAHGVDLRGHSSDVGCHGHRGKVRRVYVSVARVTSGGGCRYLRSDGTLGPSADCRKARFLLARGASRWRLRTSRAVPGGRYRVLLRAVDAAGNRERLRAGRSYLLLRGR